MDIGRQYADLMLKEMEKYMDLKLNEISDKAQGKIRKYLEKHKDVFERLNNEFENGDITEREYEQILRTELTTGKEWAKLRDEVAADMSNGQEKAIKNTAAILTGIYLFNRNHSNNQIEKTLKVKAKKKVKLPRHKTHEPIMPVKLNRRKNYWWHRLKVETVIRYGLRRGHSIDKIAKNINLVTRMDRHTCIRTARTGCTNAESMGKLDSLYDAESIGISSMKQWDAVKDERTRTSHRIVDGERIPLNEYFSNGLFRPGDPYGEPEEIYNCRCDIKGVVNGYEILNEPKAPAGMGKLEWVGEKPIPKHYDETARQYDERVARIRSQRNANS